MRMILNMRVNVMPDYSDRFGGRFLSAEHCDESFTGVVERVDDVEMKEDGGNTKRRPVLYLEGSERGIVLNATRYNFLAELCRSKDTDNWVGVEVGVRKGKTNFAGKKIDCVELFSSKTATAALDDAIPF